jgi:Domain of unknown function (DUF4920)
MARSEVPLAGRTKLVQTPGTMRSPILPCLLLAAVSQLAACAKAPAPSEAAPPAAPTGVQHASLTELKPLAKKKFGADITERASTGIDALLREPDRYTSKTVRTEGVVSAVCQSMGCWMEIRDEAGQAHIKMAGHSFFVPKDASGHRAVVQGTVLSVTRPKDECASEAEKQTGAVAKVEIVATGVEFVN